MRASTRSSPATSRPPAGCLNPSGRAGSRGLRPPAPKSTREINQAGRQGMNDANGHGGLTRETLKLGEIELELHQGGSGPPLLYLHGGSGPAASAPFLATLA